MSDALATLPRWTRRLGPGITPAQVARDARAAGLSFLEGSGSRWGKRELAAWLIGPYARVTGYAGGPRHDHSPACDRHAAPHGSSVSEADVAAVLSAARWHVLADLETAALPDPVLTFPSQALRLRLVEPAQTDDGVAWLPVDRRARLRMRVLSLFAADALAMPLDYARALHVCHRCESVVFDAVARSRGHCAQPDGTK